MKINPAIRADAQLLIDRLRDTQNETQALDVLIAAEFENLPSVAGAALIVLAASTKETHTERTP